MQPYIWYCKSHPVALRKESVDRNIVHAAQKCVAVVALRKESVDRNYGAGKRFCKSDWSLSARRAWIEIGRICELYPGGRVALRKESVDRNFCEKLQLLSMKCRSPQGERG